MCGLTKIGVSSFKRSNFGGSISRTPHMFLADPSKIGVISTKELIAEVP